MNLLLPIAVFVPIFLGAILLATPRLPAAVTRTLAALGFVFPVVAALVLWTNFAPETPGAFDYVTKLPVGLSSIGVSLTLGLNGLGMPLFAMAAIVGLAAGIRAMTNPPEGFEKYLGLVLFMLGGLLGLFASMNAVFFYFFHEFALIPTFILMLRWGGHGRRSAAIFMAVYLTVGAMISLGGLIALYVKSNAVSYDIADLKHAAALLPAATQKTLFGVLLLGFGILVSLFPFHNWAPEGYNTAPASVSMLHAGVLKKFGLFGLIQIGAYVLPEGLKAWENVIIWLALGNVVLLGLVTMTQRDLKRLVSWSSVAHMGACFLGIAAYASGAVTGLGGAVFLMFAHGLSVALLFSLSQNVFERLDSFSFKDAGGLAAKTPVLAALFVAATMASIGLPGFANFWGELTVFASLAYKLGGHPWIVIAAISGVVISAVYGLRAAAAVFFGPQGENVRTRDIADIRPAERAVAALLLAALLATGFAPSLVTKPVNDALSAFRTTTAPAAATTPANAR